MKKLTREQNEIINNLKQEFLKSNETKQAPAGSLIDFASIRTETELKQNNLNQTRILNDSANAFRKEVLFADIKKLNKDLGEIHFWASTIGTMENVIDQGGIEIRPIASGGKPVSYLLSDLIKIWYSNEFYYDPTLGNTIYKPALYIRCNVTAFKEKRCSTIEELCSDVDFKKLIVDWYQKINVK